MADSRPLIGINSEIVSPRGVAPFARIDIGYYDAVLNAGGLPVVLPPLTKEHYSEVEPLLDSLSGMILVGGADLDPRRQGRTPTSTGVVMAPRREDFDRLLLTKIVERKVPLLAIGVGMQLLNVHFGGTLFGHLPLDCPKAMTHFDPSGGPHRHMVQVEADSKLQEMYGTDELRVNSTHHQAINQIGKRLRVSAKAPDGIVEAIESTDESWFCIGVQWHPECDTASALDRQIFDCFVQSAARYSPEFAEV